VRTPHSVSGQGNFGSTDDTKVVNGAVGGCGDTRQLNVWGTIMLAARNPQPAAYIQSSRRRQWLARQLSCCTAEW
jgi:hypothetical protein